MFQKLREPTSQPLNYWINEHRFLLLKASAKIVLATRVSSEAVERLISAAGLLLGKLRKRVSPALVINSVQTISDMHVRRKLWKWFRDYLE